VDNGGAVDEIKNNLNKNWTIEQQSIIFSKKKRRYFTERSHVIKGHNDEYQYN
jgi:hypothetical protein